MKERLEMLDGSRITKLLFQNNSPCNSSILERKLILKSWSLQNRTCYSWLYSNPLFVTAEILSFLKEEIPTMG